ncbi:hypothetical protein A6R68_01470 [Neotoma lepida]|uniref:Tr-type G domain-containing protein n=1 Tax=Neotoma lepida TaxID=56216 RepID=A0A1A6GUH8_NEOLE|nr:hypothetical protein A6R68_01470 [Neotoma lepida]
MGKEKIHTTTVIHGQADSGKSTPGHLIYKCDMINKQNIQKCEEEAVNMPEFWTNKAESDHVSTIDISLWKPQTNKNYVMDATRQSEFIDNNNNKS